MIYVRSFQLTMHIAFEGFDLFNHDIDVGFIIKTLNLNYMINYANQCQNQKAYIVTNNKLKKFLHYDFFFIEMGPTVPKTSLNNNFMKYRAISLNNNKKFNNIQLNHMYRMNCELYI